MGFWNKLGKIALTAAPYVAAPFTGGASLLAVPAANKAVSAWSAHDAANDAAKGLAPSSFDKYLGMAGGVAGMAGGMGAFGGMGSSFGGGNFTGVGGGGVSNAAKIMGGVNAASSMLGGGSTSGGGNTSSSGLGASSPGSTGSTGGQPLAANSVMPRGGYNFQNNPMNQSNQNNPNLASSIFQGRQTAMKDQPFRAGYQVTWPGTVPFGSPPGTPVSQNTTYMPKISSDVNYGPGLFSYNKPPQQRRFGQGWGQQQQAAQ